MSFAAKDHTFAICAYKESAFLEECILSVVSGSVKSNVILATSTPNDSIKALCEKYNIPLYINEGIKGIGGDWNFAYSKADTPLVTIAHQDDIYEPEYAKEMLSFVNKSTEPIIYFSGYGELRNGEKIYNNTLLKVKKLMLSPLKIKALWKSKFIRRRILSFGCPICCPAVTFIKEKVGENPFTNDFGSNIDWQQWEIQSRKKGSFVYNKKPLMCHRIHEESTTSEIIGDNKRTEEDYKMFCKFWGKGMAKIISKIYAQSEKSNNL